MNSGIHDVEGVSVKELKGSIDAWIVEAHQMLSDLSSGQYLRNVRYARHVNMALPKDADAEIEKTVRAFFDVKWKIINSLFDLYIKESGSENFSAPLTLLKSAGFEPCRGCCYSD